MNIRIVRLNESAKVPQYTRDGDAALDLCSVTDTEIMPGCRELISIGIAIAIPDGYCGLVLPRSGNALKHGITLPNAPGLIDSNYRGEIKVPLINHDRSESFKIAAGDRIAQLLIVECPKVQFEEVSSLDDTNRGTSGFGSSGY